MSTLKEALSALHNATAPLAARFKTRSQAACQAPSSDIPLLQLPSPPPIRQRLQELGLSSSTVEKLSEIYNSRASELKHATERQRLSLSTIPSHALNNPLAPELTELRYKVLRQRYFQELDHCMSAVLRRGEELLALESQNSSDSDLAQQNGRFQPTSRPLLENFFQKNSFPNRHDKEMLARKTGMNFRQIHIWFQNRRARAKRDHEPLNYGPHDPLGDNLHPDPTDQHSDHLRFISRQVNATLPNEEVEASTSNPVDFLPWPENRCSSLDLSNSEIQSDVIPPWRPCFFHVEAGILNSPDAPPRLNCKRKPQIMRRSCDTYNDLPSSIMKPFASITSMTRVEQDNLSVKDASRMVAVVSSSISRPQEYTEGMLMRHSPTASLASRSFSQAFESQELETLSSDEYPHSSPIKRKRIDALTSPVSSPLMFLAEACSAIPSKRRKAAAFTQHLPMPIRAAHNPTATSDSSSNLAFSPLSSATSLVPISPPSSPLSRASSFSSSIPHSLFSEPSISGMSDASIPSSPITAPSSCNTEPSSPASSTYSEELFSADAQICTRSPISSDRSTCSLSPSTFHIPQVVRKVTTHEQRFFSSSASNLLRLDF